MKVTEKQALIDMAKAQAYTLQAIVSMNDDNASKLDVQNMLSEALKKLSEALDTITAIVPERDK